MRGFSLAEEDEVAQVNAPSRCGQGLLRDGCRAHARQVGLCDVGVLLVKLLRNHNRQHRIAQKLQPLIIGDASGLVRVGTMHESELQQRGVNARPPGVDEGVCVRARGYR